MGTAGFRTVTLRPRIGSSGARRGKAYALCHEHAQEQGQYTGHVVPMVPTHEDAEASLWE